MVLFVLACGICALLAYYILEPFVPSILWSLLAGAFLFPWKNRFASRVHSYLHRLEANADLLCVALFIELPCQCVDRTLEATGPFCLQRWKYCLFILLFRFAIELVHLSIVHDYLSVISGAVLLRCQQTRDLCDSPWTVGLIIIYLLALLTIYHQSWLIKSMLNIFAIPVWFVLFVYLLQSISLVYRSTLVALLILLISVGFLLDRNEQRGVPVIRKCKSFIATN